MANPEWVLVSPVNVLEELGKFQGLLKGDLVGLYREALLEESYFVEREIAEKDESLKQIIPYVMFWRGPEVFRYRRGQSGSENRLHNLWSLGVGGHINPIDGDHETAYETGLWRELSEEVHISKVLSNEVVGLINDDSTEVGRVHIGFVHNVSVPYYGLRVKEDCLENGEFVNARDIRNIPCEWESWSRLLIEGLL